MDRSRPQYHSLFPPLTLSLRPSCRSLTCAPSRGRALRLVLPDPIRRRAVRRSVSAAQSAASATATVRCPRLWTRRARVVRTSPFRAVPSPASFAARREGACHMSMIRDLRAVCPPVPAFVLCGDSGSRRHHPRLGDRPPRRRRLRRLAHDGGKGSFRVETSTMLLDKPRTRAHAPRRPRRRFCLSLDRPVRAHRGRKLAGIARGALPHLLAVEDAVQAHQRPSWSRYDDSLFTGLKTVHYVDHDQLTATQRECSRPASTACFTGRYFFITGPRRRAGVCCAPVLLPPPGETLSCWLKGPPRCCTPSPTTSSTGTIRGR